jgi:hypothetical protein
MESAIMETWRVLRLSGGWVELAAFDCGDITDDANVRRWNGIRGHAVRYVQLAEEALRAATTPPPLGQRGYYLVPARLVAGREAVYDANVWSCANNGTAKESEVVWSAVLCVDADPKRPAKTSATKEQWAAAVGVAGVVRETLLGAGAPEGALGTGHSGNGAHVHVYLDLRWSPEVKSLRERVLRALGVLCHYVMGPTTRVSIDQTLADGARYIPLYGTMKRKGGRGHADRPWRKTALVGPAVVTPLDIVGLRRLADALEAKLTPEAIDLWEKEWSKESKRAPPTPAKSARSTASSKVTSSNLYSGVNKLPMTDVAAYVGIDISKCSQCGNEKGAGMTKHPSDGIDLFHCFHDSCSAKPNLTNTMLILLARGVAEGDKKGTFDAVAEVARHFGIAVPKHATKPKAPSKEARAAAFASVMAAVTGEVVAAEPATLNREGSTPNQEPAATKEREREPQEVAPAERVGDPAVEEAPPSDETDAGVPGAGTEGDASESPQVEPNSPQDVDLDALLEAALGLDAIQQEAVIDAIAKRFGIGKGVLRKRLAELEEECEDEDEGSGTKADVLAELIAEIPVVRGADNRVFALFGNHAIPVKSGAFKARIANIYHERTGGFVSTPTIDKIVLPLLGGTIRRTVVPIRYAYDTDGSIWIDVGDGVRYVHITKDAVTDETACPIAFSRPDGMRALPPLVIPKDDDECASVLDTYRAFLRLDRGQFVGVFAWQVGAMRPMEVPGHETGENEDEFTEYTILKITGAEGTGKTSLGDYVCRPVDPRFPLHIGLPVKVEDISISGENARVLSYDNSSYISQEHSNALARRATGDGNEVRELYSARDQTVTVGSNPVIITSIADAVTEPDLLSRCLSLDIDKSKKRTPKKKLKATFKPLYPKVFGALCHAVSRALRNVDAMDVPDDVRMQDSAQWALAAAPAAGFKRDEVLAAFTQSVEQADAIVMERAVVVALLSVVNAGTTWKGSMTDLHGLLTDAYQAKAPATGTPTRKLPKDWPDKAERLRGQLKKLGPTLERAGVFIDWKQSGSRREGRNVTIVRGAESEGSATEPTKTPVATTGMDVDDGFDEWLHEAVDSGGDGSAVSGDASKPATVTAQALDSIGHGDGGDGGDGFSSPQKNGERRSTGHGNGQSGALLTPTSSCSRIPEGADQPSPPSPASPPAENTGDRGDGRGGDSSPVRDQEPSPCAPAANGVLVPSPASTSAPIRARAVWATYDGTRLTVAFREEDEPAHVEPGIFDFRGGDRARLLSILAIYGWSGVHDERGTYVGFSGSVYVTTRPHVFEGGRPARIVSSCLGVVTAVAS